MAQQSGWCGRRLGMWVAVCAVINCPVVCWGQAEFKKSAINLPASSTAFNLSHDLDGDGRNDAVAVFQRRVMVFFQQDDGTYSSAPDIEIGSDEPIPADYAAVALGKVAPETGDQVLLIGPGGVDYLPLGRLSTNSAGPVAPQRLIDADLAVSPGPDLTFLQSVTDLDGDGTNELVLPEAGRLAVWTSSDGAPYQKVTSLDLSMLTMQQTALVSEPPLLGSPFFSQPDTGSMVQLRPQAGLWQSVQYSVTNYCEPLLVLDFNMDRLTDVVTRRGVFFQNAEGNFTRTASNVYRDISSAMVPHQTRNELVTAPNLLDFNGDQRLDTFRVEVSAARLSPRTDISIYLGEEGLKFPDKPTQTLRTRDFAYTDAIPVGDVNGDGAHDLALFHLDFQPSSMQSQLKSYLRNGLEGDLRFYLWDKKLNRFPDSAAFKHPVLLNYEIYGARQFFRQQVSISEDMTGDGLADLVLKTGPQEISIYENKGGEGFARSAWAKVNTAPMKFSSLVTTKLNGDNKGDLIVNGYLDDQEDRVIYMVFASK